MLGLKRLLGLQKRCEGVQELFRSLKVGRECVQSRYFGSLVCPPLHSLTMSQAAPSSSYRASGDCDAEA